MQKRLTNIKLFYTFQKYNIKYLPKDILTGIIIAAVSIPISMGYAQIAGLPAVYGLYGSVFPILIFAIFSTSPQFIFGVDAAPAALVGAGLLTLGIEGGTKEAMQIVPILTLCVAIWLMIFFLCGAGKLVNYISSPVMGGFISGICTTIILMQVPKLMGGSAGTGELIELSEHLYESLDDLNKWSLILGLSTLAILLISKKIIPKFPMAVVMMFAGAILSANTDIEAKGVMLLSSVESGLPHFIIPAVDSIDFARAMGMSLSVAIVIMAETLLSENNFALKNGYAVNDNQELLAFSLANLSAAFTGCTPMNGSVSRTSMSEQYGGKTQLTSVVAGACMIGVLLFGTGFIGYLPVPILTAIVISALMGATEFHLAAKLWKVSRTEFNIFVGAFLGVLFLGTIYGVMIGVVLSFTNVIIRAADPPRCFLGIMPGHNEFFNMSQFKHTYPVQGIVIYRFSSNLFFANISIFMRDIEEAIEQDTKAVIIDAGGIGSIDVTSAERLEILYESLKERGIKLYITEHIAAVNEQMRQLGIGHFVTEGVTRRTIPMALREMSISAPYPIVGTHNSYHSVARKRAESISQEFVWAFGKNAEDEIEKQIVKQIDELKKNGDIEKLIHGSWNQLGTMDEDEWIEHLESHMTEIARVSGKNEKTIAMEFEKRRKELAEKIRKEHPELARKFEERRHILDEHLKQRHPDIYVKIIKLREEIKDAD